MYRYSQEEFAGWKLKLEEFQRQSGTIGVIFNNNSGGDASDNAKLLMAMLDQRTPEGRDPLEQEEMEPEPEQLDLFDSL